MLLVFLELNASGYTDIMMSSRCLGGAVTMRDERVPRMCVTEGGKDVAFYSMR